MVARIDHATNLFRAYYPDEDRFDSRTEWRQCKDWQVDVTFSPAELQRQAAKTKLDQEVSRLDAAELAAVMVLVDDPDPAKALGKLEALRRMGVIKASPAAAHAAAIEAKKGK